MVNLIQWEAIRTGRLKSVEKLIEELFHREINLIIDKSSTTLDALREKVFKSLSANSNIIFLAHISNLVDKNKFLSIIEALNSLYPAMVVVLYSGGTISFSKKDRLLYLDGMDFTFAPAFPGKILVKTVAGNADKDFAKSIHLTEALQVFSEEKDTASFFDALDGRFLKVEDKIDLKDDVLSSVDLADVLTGMFGAKVLFVLNSKTATQADGKKHCFATSIGEFNEQLDTKGVVFDAIVIIAELNWGKPGTVFEGLEIAINLRKKRKYLVPLVILSRNTAADFERLYEGSKDSLYNIIFAPATYLVTITENETAESLGGKIGNVLYDARRLSVAGLQDINTMLLDETGDLIDKFTHALFISKDIKILNLLFEHALKIMSDRSLEIKEFWQGLLEAKKGNDEKGFEVLRNGFLQLLEGKLSNLPAVYADKQGWAENNRLKILLIEDSPEYQKILVERLGKRFECKLFSIAQDAVNYLKENDPAMEVGCVISDWRLYKESSSNFWQEMQGYEALQQIAVFHMATLVALTSETDKNVHAIRNLLGINIHLFKKQYLQPSPRYDDLWNIFADNIEDFCLQALALVSAQPTGTNWTTENAKNKHVSLKSKYITRRRTDWESFEAAVAARADKSWNYYKAVITDINPFLRSIDVEFGLVLSDNLENILIVRRLWLSLWFKRDKIDFIRRIMPEETPEINIYIILKGIDLDEEEKESPPKRSDVGRAETEGTFIPEWKRKLQNNANAFSNVLCIVKTDLPDGGILPEEKAWLKKHQISIEKNANEYYAADEPDNF